MPASVPDGRMPQIKPLTLPIIFRLLFVMNQITKAATTKRVLNHFQVFEKIIIAVRLRLKAFSFFLLIKNGNQ